MYPLIGTREPIEVAHTVSTTRRLIDEVRDALLAGGPVVSTAADGAAALEAGIAALISAKDGRRVSLPLTGGDRDVLDSEPLAYRQSLFRRLVASVEWIRNQMPTKPVIAVTRRLPDAGMDMLAAADDVNVRVFPKIVLHPRRDDRFLSRRHRRNYARD
ncbi:MAG: hypothetical protein R2845_14100 [Thermomicrobiales bacterium]